MKKWISLFLTGLLCILPGCGRQEPASDLTPLTLNEVAHSIFYAPQYVAIENGYFAEEGIDLTLVTGFGADKVATALVSGEADIGFMGSESSIYIYNQNPEDYIVNFAQLTQRAGNFLVARKPSDNFTWEDIKGAYVLGGRKGGMPQMVFEFILKKNNTSRYTGSRRCFHGTSRFAVLSRRGPGGERHLRRRGSASPSRPCPSSSKTWRTSWGRSSLSAAASASG